MVKRLYRPGSRHTKYRGTGKQSDNRFAFARTALGQMVGLIHNNHEESDPLADPEQEPITPEYGPEIFLILPQPNRAAVKWHLTKLTLDELKVTRQLLNLLFDLAEPICDERDRIANHAYENEGDDSFLRVYRDVPQFVIRERALESNYKGVHFGFKDALERARRDDNSSGRLRRSRDELANSESKDSVSQDNGQEANES